MKRLSLFVALALPATLPALPVTTYDDEPDNGGSIDDEFEDGEGLSLREAIGLQNRALTDEPIRFDSFVPLAAGTVVTITLTSGEIPITAPVDVQNSLIDDLGKRVPITIDAGGTSRHLAIAMPDTGFPAVFFQEGFHFTNGFADGDGGSIHISGSVETEWSDCRFTANSATGSGGAIYLGSNTYARFNHFGEAATTFEDCHAGLHGGAVSASTDAGFDLGSATTGCTAAGNGGAFHASGGRIEVFNTSIENCEAASGGAIFIDGGFLTLSGATLSGNSAAADGGAVYAKSVEFRSFDSPVSASSNTATGSGGAFYFENSTAFDTFDTAFVFTGNTAGAAGGGLYATASQLLSIRMSGSGNTANGAGGGGALFLEDTAVLWGTTSTFSANQATAGPGGAIRITGGEAGLSAMFSQLIFQNNTASGDGGAVSAGGGASLIFDAGSATGNRSLAGSGGAFAAASGADISLSEITLTGNSAALSGGAYFSRRDSALFSCVLRENIAGEDGGGACINAPEDAQGVNAFLEGCLFEDNISGASGGGLFTRDVTLHLNATFRDNTATADGGGLAASASESSFGAEIRESNITASGNSAGRGGGLFFGVGINTTGSLQIGDISDNEASFQGGGLWIGGASESSFIYDALSEASGIRGNRCTGAGEGAGGGGVYATGTALLIQSPGSYDISQNTSARDGGGILFVQSVLIGSPSFTENTAGQNGGGLATDTHLFLGETTFQKNSAVSGGGVYISENQFTTINNSSFEENTATADGGALAIDGGNCEIINTRFLSNSALSGGALHFTGERLNISEYSRFIENTATNDGGALAVAADDGNFLEFSLADAVFTECTAGGSGGALNLSGALGFASISTCAFDTCTAESGGAIAHGTTDLFTPVEIRRSGFINNTTTLDGGAVALSGRALADFTQCSFAGNSARSGGAFSVGTDCSLSLSVTTVGWNHATADGGGISASGSIFLRGSTVYGNTADARGGGIYSSGDQCRFDEVIIAKNTAPEFPDAKTEFIEPGSTFIITDPSGTSGGTVADPLLRPERHFIAPVYIESVNTTLYIPNSRLVPHALSPAIDAGASSTGTANDQRWELTTPRVVSGRTDFGSVEFQGVPTYASWAEASIQDPALRPETADPDSDGIPNALERLFGTDPVTAGPSPIAIIDTPGGITLSYPLGNVPPGSDIVQWSGDLSDWNLGFPAGSMRSIAVDLSNPSRVVVSTTIPALPRAFFVIGAEN